MSTGGDAPANSQPQANSTPNVLNGATSVGSPAASGQQNKAFNQLYSNALPYTQSQSPIGVQANPNMGPFPAAMTPTQPSIMQGMGGPAGGMQPFSQQSIPPQLQQLAQQYGGKGGMPGQPSSTQQSPMQQSPIAQTPMQSQGLGALMTAQQKPQSSLNSLQ